MPRVRRFRDDRIALIRRGQGSIEVKRPVQYQSNADETQTPVVPKPEDGPNKRGVVALHIVPLSGAGPADLMQARYHAADLALFGSRGTEPSRPNLDGLLVLAGEEDGRATAFIQLFRDGRLETVRGMSVYHETLNPTLLRSHLIDSLPRYVTGLTTLGFGPPFVLMLSLIGVRVVSLRFQFDTTYRADRDDLIIEPLTLDLSRLEGDWVRLLRPLLDAFWNAFGVLRSPDFSEAGEWTPQRPV
jgi:hypothetical protein